MMALFSLLIRCGQWALLLLIFTLQAAMFAEIKALGLKRHVKRHFHSSSSSFHSFSPSFHSFPSSFPSFPSLSSLSSFSLPSLPSLSSLSLHSSSLHWYWFFTSIFFTYGRITDHYLHVTLPYHSFLSFTLYVLGLLTFVISLKKGLYKYQFERFAWTHLTLLLVVVQSTFTIVNMFQGLIWFLLPALLIISNDCWAYVWGTFFGRTPLIRLSPKKTWEGFIGAFVMTIITGWLLSSYLASFESMICPKVTIDWHTPHCIPPQVFQTTSYFLPPSLINAFPFLPSHVHVSPIQMHALVFSLFASVIAPFGGFFASGFKRAFHIKDFGESIPGHGGVTDRMDCQIMMGFFVWVYYWTFINNETDAVRMAKSMKLIDRMATDEIVRLYFILQDRLSAQGVHLIRNE